MKINNNVVIIGENSRMTKAFLKSHKFSVVVPKAEYMTWKSKINLVRSLKNFDNSTLIITKAILNPKLNESEINYWNYTFPKRIITEIFALELNIRIVTFGSIHELSKLSNPYLNSKRKLAYFINAQNNSNIIHYRLHTIFGEGYPIRAMFLGQIYESLVNNSTFRMSHGNQLRQYHTYSEIVSIVTNNLSEIAALPNIYNINGDTWVTLRDLASSIFYEFGKEEMLKIGEIDSPQNEITKDTLELNNKPVILGDVKCKVINYMRVVLTNNAGFHNGYIQK